MYSRIYKFRVSYFRTSDATRQNHRLGRSTMNGKSVKEVSRIEKICILVKMRPNFFLKM